MTTLGAHLAKFHHAMPFLRRKPKTAMYELNGPWTSFWDLDEHDDTPTSAGVYFLLANLRTKFRYPVGQSSVYYIGKADNLHRRLKEHLTAARDCEAAWRKKEDNRTRFYPKYQYAVAYGDSYAWIPVWQGMTAKSLESWVIGDFIATYHAPPVGNQKIPWKWV
jgi:hypothetical protein